MQLDLAATGTILGLILAVGAVFGGAWGLARKAARDEIRSQDSDGYKTIVEIATKVATHHKDTCPVRGELIRLIEGEREERREGRGEIMAAITTMRSEVLAAVSHLAGRVDAVMNGRHG